MILLKLSAGGIPLELPEPAEAADWTGFKDVPDAASFSRDS
jgi:hypothetical protein